MKTNAFNDANNFFTCQGGAKVVPAGVPFLDNVSYSVPSDAGAGDPENQVLVVGSVQWNISERLRLQASMP